MTKTKMRIFVCRKAYAKTLEAIIAVALSFLFIAYFVPPTKTETEFVKPDLDLVRVLEQNVQFRNCVMNEDYACMNATLRDYYPYFADVYDYRVNVSTDPEISGVELPQVEVHMESFMAAGNDSFLYPKTFRLYYWEKPLKAVRP